MTQIIQLSQNIEHQNDPQQNTEETLPNVPALFVVNETKSNTKMIIKYIGYDTNTLTYVYLPINYIFSFIAQSNVDLENMCKFQSVQIPTMPLPLVKLSLDDIKKLSPCTDSEVFEILSKEFQPRSSSIILPP